MGYCKDYEVMMNIIEINKNKIIISKRNQLFLCITQNYSQLMRWDEQNNKVFQLILKFGFGIPQVKSDGWEKSVTTKAQKGSN